MATVAVSAVVAVPTAGAATAQGATAVSTGQKLFYTAAAGQTNHLKIDWALGPTDPDSQLADYIYTFDDTVTITPGAGCVRPDARDTTKAVCTVTEPNTSASDLDTLIADLAPDNSAQHDVQAVIRSVDGYPTANWFACVAPASTTYKSAEVTK
ncbi:hypothetical protein [Streptomyces sp. NBC_00198]|uniref:hypothetical protein n=1 Tax=Streptomyces sp. NBC_00198 TaxID=2975677 RepID=UPI002253EC7D|nr:hypothetical protein [Streptomyces sp. NBC_00198]MCX5283915.1 hypothetical protein [Streptomyces sp. NBC_00198]